MSAETMPLTRERLVEIVEKYLEPHQPIGYRLKVLADGIKQDDNFWHVVVQPTRDDVRSYDYHGRLAEAENDIEDHEKLKVLLVPVLPGD